MTIDESGRYERTVDDRFRETWQLDEQRREVARHCNEFTGAMPAMSHQWVHAARQLVHRPHHREAPGFMGNIWTCNVCGATRRW